MRSISKGLTLLLALALIGSGCDSAGEDAAASAGGAADSSEPTREPDAAEILVPPPAGAEFLPDASALEDSGGDAASYGTDGNFQSDEGVAYVYLTDLAIADVVRHYRDQQGDSPYYINLDDVYSDVSSGTLDIEEQPAAPISPDEMEAMLEQYRDQGAIEEDEAEEALAEMPRYRELYPKIKDVTLRSLDFTVEEESEGRDEYRYVEVELVRPYIDPAALEVRDRTGIRYIVHRMQRQSD